MLGSGFAVQGMIVHMITGVEYNIVFICTMCLRNAKHITASTLVITHLPLQYCSHCNGVIGSFNSLVVEELCLSASQSFNKQFRTLFYCVETHELSPIKFYCTQTLWQTLLS